MDHKLLTDKVTAIQTKLTVNKIRQKQVKNMMSGLNRQDYKYQNRSADYNDVAFKTVVVFCGHCEYNRPTAGEVLLCCARDQKCSWLTHDCRRK